MARRQRPFGLASAEAVFLAQGPAGKRKRIKVRVGRPYRVTKNDWACAVALTGLEPRFPDMHGYGALQALCMALALARMRLNDFVESGGRIFDVSGGELDARTLRAIFGVSST